MKFECTFCIDFCLSSFYKHPQGSVVPGYEPVPVAHVHLLLVLCHCCYGDSHLHLQIH